MAFFLGLLLVVLSSLFLPTDCLSLPGGDLFDPTPEFVVDIIKGPVAGIAGYNGALLETDSLNDQAAHLESRNTLYTAEVLAMWISDLRQNYSVSPVVQENELVLQAYESVKGCSQARVCPPTSDSF